MATNWIEEEERLRRSQERWNLGQWLRDQELEARHAERLGALNRGDMLDLSTSMRNERLRQKHLLENARTSIRDLLASAQAKDLVTSAELDARQASLDARTADLAMSRETFAAAGELADVQYREGREVLRAERSALVGSVDAALESIAAGRQEVASERELRGALAGARRRETRRETRREIGAALAESAGRGGRGSSAWVASMEARSEMAEELALQDMEHRVRMLTLARRERELEQAETETEGRRGVQEARLRQAEAELEAGRKLEEAERRQQQTRFASEQTMIGAERGVVGAQRRAAQVELDVAMGEAGRIQRRAWMGQIESNQRIIQQRARGRALSAEQARLKDEAGQRRKAREEGMRRYRTAFGSRAA